MASWRRNRCTGFSLCSPSPSSDAATIRRRGTIFERSTERPAPAVLASALCRLAGVGGAHAVSAVGPRRIAVATREGGFFARERLAGYDPDALARAVITIVGCGAAGSNAALCLSLAGVGELRFIDFDEVEPSNLTRSPFFDRRRIGGARKRYKARELALGALAATYAPDPVVRFATRRIEEVGLSALAGSSVIISAVDSFSVRGLLSDLARLLGVPLIEVGFFGTRGQVSVIPNRRAEEPCWRCLHPQVGDGAVSCSLYARRVTDGGGVPATQPLAAVFGALAAEHAIQAAHGRFPLGGRLLALDLHRGGGRPIEIAADPSCPGAHRVLEPQRTLEVGADDPLSALLAAAASLAVEPVIRLPWPFVVEAPCARCGAPVAVGKPSWKVTRAPECRTCPAIPRLGGRAAVVVTSLAKGDGFGERRLRTLGLMPAAVIEVFDRRTGRVVAARLRGSAEDVFETRRRNEGGAAGKEPSKAITE